MALEKPTSTMPSRTLTSVLSGASASGWGEGSAALAVSAGAGDVVGAGVCMSFFLVDENIAGCDVLHVARPGGGQVFVFVEGQFPRMDRPFLAGADVGALAVLAPVDGHFGVTPLGPFDERHPVGGVFGIEDGVVAVFLGHGATVHVGCPLGAGPEARPLSFARKTF